MTSTLVPAIVPYVVMVIVCCTTLLHCTALQVSQFIESRLQIHKTGVESFQWSTCSIFSLSLFVCVYCIQVTFTSDSYEEAVIHLKKGLYFIERLCHSLWRSSPSSFDWCVLLSKPQGQHNNYSILRSTSIT